MRVFILPVVLALTCGGCALPQRPALPTAEMEAQVAKTAVPGSFQRCGGPTGEFALEGGETREAVRSSVEGITDNVLVGSGVGASVARQGFRPSLKHDLCYNQGRGTYGRTRKDCDAILVNDMLDMCKYAQKHGKTFGCNFRSRIMFAAVSLGGETFYGDNAQAPCDFDGGVNAPRAYLLNGDFAQIGGRRTHFISVVVADPETIRIGFHADAANLSTQTAVDHSAPLPNVSRLEVRNVATGGSHDVCRRSPCTFRDLNLSARDLVRVRPAVLDADGDGDDDLVLAVFHGGETGDSDPHGLGVLLLPILIDKEGAVSYSAAFPAALGRSSRADKESWKLDRDPPGRKLSNLNEDDLKTARASIAEPYHVGRLALPNCISDAPCPEQLISVALNSGSLEGIDVKVYTIATTDGVPTGVERQRLTVSVEGEGKYRSRLAEECGYEPLAEVKEQELYKRLQYETELLTDASGTSRLVFSFRERTDRDNACLVRREWAWPTAADGYPEFSQYGYGTLLDDHVKRADDAHEALCGRCKESATSEECLRACNASTSYQSLGLRDITTNFLRGWDRLRYPWFTVWPEVPMEADLFRQPQAGAPPLLVATFLEGRTDAQAGQPRNRKVYSGERIIISEMRAPIGDRRLASVKSDVVLDFDDVSHAAFGGRTDASKKLRAAWMGEYFELPVLAGRFGPKGEFGLLWVRPACPLPDGCTKGGKPFGARTPADYDVLVAWRFGEGAWDAAAYACTLPSNKIDAGQLFRWAPLFVTQAANGPGSAVFAAYSSDISRPPQLIPVWSWDACKPSPDIRLSNRRSAGR